MSRWLVLTSVVVLLAGCLLKNDLRIAVSNKLDVDVHDLRIARDGDVFVVGDVPHGAKVLRVIDNSVASGATVIYRKATMGGEFSCTGNVQLAQGMRQWLTVVLREGGCEMATK